MGRYNRQIALGEWNSEDQKELGYKTAAVVGVGGLGSTIVNSLARFGIGKLIIFDDDGVKARDLHRQFMYDEGDVGEYKVEIAADKLRRINSSVEVVPFKKKFERENTNLVDDADIILDGSDNIETRYLLNKISHEKNIPWIYGSCTGTRGMSFNILPGESPCFECLISSSPPSEDLEKPEDVGTLSTTVSTVGLYQVTQAIKILLGEDYKKDLFFMDMWKGKFEFIRVERDRNCDICRN